MSISSDTGENQTRSISEAFKSLALAHSCVRCPFFVRGFLFLIDVYMKQAKQRETGGFSSSELDIPANLSRVWKESNVLLSQNEWEDVFSSLLRPEASRHVIVRSLAGQFTIHEARHIHYTMKVPMNNYAISRFFHSWVEIWTSCLVYVHFDPIWRATILVL